MVPLNTSYITPSNIEERRKFRKFSKSSVHNRDYELIPMNEKKQSSLGSFEELSGNKTFSLSSNLNTNCALTTTSPIRSEYYDINESKNSISALNNQLLSSHCTQDKHKHHNHKRDRETEKADDKLANRRTFQSDIDRVILREENRLKFELSKEADQICDHLFDINDYNDGYDADCDDDLNDFNKEKEKFSYHCNEDYEDPALKMYEEFDQELEERFNELNIS